MASFERPCPSNQSLDRAEDRADCPGDFAHDTLKRQTRATLPGPGFKSLVAIGKAAISSAMGWIRLLLALAVILAHTGSLKFIGQTVGGLIAVQTFFMLSGFYMALVLCEKYSGWAEFYWNRLSRIFSGYWVALIVAIVIARLADVNHFNSILQSNWDWTSKAFMLFANVFLFGSDAMMFLYPSASGLSFTQNFQQTPPQLYAYHYLSPAWSLPVELAFYAIAPFVVKSVPKIAIIALASLACRFASYAIFGESDPWIYRFLPSELMFFMLGALAYHISARLKQRGISETNGRLAFWGVIVLILGFKSLTRWQDQPFWHPATFYLIFWLCLPAVFHYAQFKKPLAIALDRWAGEISYMVYLTHIIVVNNLLVLTGVKATPIIAILLTIALSSALTPLSNVIDGAIRSRFRSRRHCHGR